ncbi:MAG: hypothetical protein ABJN22_14525 [Litorimonas sp.]
MIDFDEIVEETITSISEQAIDIAATIAVSANEEPWEAFEAYLNSRKNGWVDTQILAFYLPASTGIGAYLEAGLSPDEARFAWLTTTGELLKFTRSHYKNVTLANLEATLRFPNEFIEFCVNKFRFNGSESLQAGIHLPEIDPINALIASQLAKQDEAISSLQQELDARSSPIEPFKIPENFDIQGVYERLSYLEDERNEALKHIKDYKRRDEKNKERISSLKDQCMTLQTSLQSMQSNLEDASKLSEDNSRLLKKVPLLVENLRVMQIELNEAGVQSAERIRLLQAEVAEKADAAKVLERNNINLKDLLVDVESTSVEKIDSLTSQISTMEKKANELIETTSTLQSKLLAAQAKLSDMKVLEVNNQNLKERLAYVEAASAKKIDSLTRQTTALEKKSAKVEAATAKKIDSLTRQTTALEKKSAKIDEAHENALTKDKILSEHLKEVQLNSEIAYLNYLDMTTELEELKQAMRWRDVRSKNRMSSLEKELTEKQSRIDRFESSLSWKLARSLGVLLSTTGLSRQKISKEDLKLIKRSGYFDAKWYIKTYPDVRGASITPLEHYLRHGFKEGRSPGPDFNSQRYLKDNPEVSESGENPLLHFLNISKKI